MLRIAGKCQGGSTSSRSAQNLLTAVGILQRNLSIYAVHPEMLRQALRQKDATILCKFFESEEYQKKVAEFVELQNKILTTITPGAEMKYEHVLSCAPPKHKKVKPLAPKALPQELKKRRKRQRGTVMEMILDKTKKDESPSIPNELEEKPVQRAKKNKVKTTIMPLYLKKIQQNREDRRDDIERLNHDSQDQFAEFLSRGERDQIIVSEHPSKRFKNKRQKKAMKEETEHEDEEQVEVTNKAGLSSSSRSAPNLDLGTTTGKRTFITAPPLRKQRSRSEGDIDLMHTKNYTVASIPTKKKKSAKSEPKVNFSSVEKEAENNLKTSERKDDFDNLEGTNIFVAIKNKRNYSVASKKPLINLFHRVKSGMSARYLIRLPKTTIEGYRVLMYAVKDPDPTKMNFSDCVKGFCMYNDCVLSEDGLQDGYIVIFDMKSVCLGHLARVSLPALKCFMHYIQEAHPCRLKSIHVLNTTSWIHHVMRLVVPLVRSELLNLVQFHKGNIPDNFPIELLPMDYGGEAPSVDDLDRSTKQLVYKYRDWLVESSHFKADESQRVKKSGWWGLFGSSKAQNVELDEKTILKNLQID